MKLLSILDTIVKEQDAEKAASGPQKCGITTGLDKANSAADRAANKENKAWDKEVAKQDKEDVKQRALENKKFISLDYDRDGDPLDKSTRREYYGQYQQFVKNNPGLLDNEEGFDSKQKYAVVSKILDYIRRVPQISYTVKLKSKFGVTPQSTVNDIIGVVNKMGGFVSFMNWFNSGGPDIK
jgi:hypothetical protein